MNQIYTMDSMISGEYFPLEHSKYVISEATDLSGASLAFLLNFCGNRSVQFVQLTHALSDSANLSSSGRMASSSSSVSSLFSASSSSSMPFPDEVESIVLFFSIDLDDLELAFESVCLLCLRGGEIVRVLPNFLPGLLTPATTTSSPSILRAQDKVIPCFSLKSTPRLRARGKLLLLLLLPVLLLFGGKLIYDLTELWEFEFL